MRTNSRSPIAASKRVAYMNNETPLRDPATIFHSPFKNGKRNPEFSNPTLMSSSIFYQNEPSIEFRNSQVPSRSKSPSDYLNGIMSTTSAKSIRLKRQFNNTQENIKDHFTGGLTIPAERKRALKNYLHAQRGFDLERQIEAIDKNTEIPKAQGSSIPNNSGMQRAQSTCQLLEGDQQNQQQFQQEQYQGSQHNISMFRSPSQVFLTPRRISNNQSQPFFNGIERSQTPRSNASSKMINQPTTPKRNKVIIPTLNLPLGSTTPVRLAYNLTVPKKEANATPVHLFQGISRQEQANTTPKRQQMEFFKKQEISPNNQRRDQNDNQRGNDGQSGVGNNQTSINSGFRIGRTPTRLKFERQVFPQMKECCDKCINEKMVDDKVKEQQEQREKEKISQIQAFKQFEEEQKAEKDREHQKIIQARRQYGEIANAMREQERISKETILQEKTKQAEQLNLAAEQEMKYEVERNKLEKIKKINEYREMLRDQIIQKDLLLKQQALKENRQQTPQSNENDVRYVQDTFPQQQKKNKQTTQSMIDYRETILGQLVEHEKQKIIERSQEKEFYQKIAREQKQEGQMEKQFEIQVRNQKKQQLQEFIRARQQATQAEKEKRCLENEQIRQIENEIQNQETAKRIEQRALVEIQKQQLGQSLKKQIEEKDALKKSEDKNKGVMRKSGSTNMLVNPSSNCKNEKSSPCGKCHKIVPFQRLGLFNC